MNAGRSAGSAARCRCRIRSNPCGVAQRVTSDRRRDARSPWRSPRHAGAARAALAAPAARASARVGCKACGQPGAPVQAVTRSSGSSGAVIRPGMVRGVWVPCQQDHPPRRYAQIGSSAPIAAKWLGMASGQTPVRPGSPSAVGSGRGCKSGGTVIGMVKARGQVLHRARAAMRPGFSPCCKAPVQQVTHGLGGPVHVR